MQRSAARSAPGSVDARVGRPLRGHRCAYTVAVLEFPFIMSQKHWFCDNAPASLNTLNLFGQIGENAWR